MQKKTVFYVDQAERKMLLRDLLIVVAVEQRKGQAISSPMIVWSGLSCKGYNLAVIYLACVRIGIRQVSGVERLEVF